MNKSVFSKTTFCVSVITVPITYQSYRWLQNQPPDESISFFSLSIFVRYKKGLKMRWVDSQVHASSICICKVPGQVHVQLHRQVHVQLHRKVHVLIYMYMYTHTTHMYSTCTSTCTHLHVHAYTHKLTQHICIVHGKVHVLIYMYMYIYTTNKSTCTCIYTQQIKVHVLIYMYMYIYTHHICIVHIQVHVLIYMYMYKTYV